MRAGARTPAELPAPPTALVGREHDTAALGALLRTGGARLVTLTGPGGVGKTRLALQVAAELRDAFADGVCFVDLAPLREAGLVPAAIARSLGLEAGTAPLDLLARALRDRQMLLLLDNLEQLRDAAPQLAELLAAAPQLRMLVTSRAPLRLRSEHEYPVAPLVFPAERAALPLDGYAAVQLFVRRARAVRPGFTLGAQDAQAVAAICRQLDGLPLAIELAAPHLRLLTPPALLRRLARRLALLSDGAHDLPVRQRSLRATLDWSYRLLRGRAQQIFARLGVFVGGATIEAVERVCAPAARGDILPDVLSLVEQSLLLQAADPAGEPRLILLGTIREYALERLAGGEAERATRARHAEYYLAMAEQAAPQLRGPLQPAWLDRLEADHDNLRAAFTWLCSTGQAEAALRLAAALHWFWDRRGYIDEGRARIRAALELAEAEADPPASLLRARAAALYGAATLAFDQGDFAAVAALAVASADLARRLGEPFVQTLAMLRLAFVSSAGAPAQARLLLEEAQLQARALGDPWLLGVTLFVSAQALLFGAGDATSARAVIGEALQALEICGDPYLIAHSTGIYGLTDFADGKLDAARTSLERALAALRLLHDARSVALIAATTADVARCQGDLARAADLYSESMAGYIELGNRTEIPAILHSQGYVALGCGDYSQARDLFAESLRRQRNTDNPAGVAEGLCGLAALALAVGQFERAARLFGAAAAIRAAHPALIWPAERITVERYSTALRARLPAPTYRQLYAEGQALAPDLAVSYALADEPHAEQPRPGPLTRLSEREREVAALIAQGATNRAIAAALVISERTVERHVANMFAKLDVGSRARIAALAAEAGLADQGR